MRKVKKAKVIVISEPINDWFSLSYATYLVIPRSILQSTPVAWQKKFVKLLNILDEIPEFSCPTKGKYQVYTRLSNGCFVSDEFRDYERGSRKIFYDAKQFRRPLGSRKRKREVRNDC